MEVLLTEPKDDFTDDVLPLDAGLLYISCCPLLNDDDDDITPLSLSDIE
jgi:hypothetical protein